MRNKNILVMVMFSVLDNVSEEPLYDGWYDVRSLAYPVIVNNGEVTGLNLE